jgi:hypothetical protein
LLFLLMSAILRFFIVFYAAAFPAFSFLIDPVIIFVLYDPYILRSGRIG